MNPFRKISIILYFLLIALSSCFEEDEKIEPHESGDEITHTYEESIYENQSYFDLGSNEVVNSNPNSVWNIAFACGKDEWHIIVNSSDYWGIYRTGSEDMGTEASSSAPDQWKNDKSDGNPDSTGIGNWVSFSESDTLYSNEVYILGQYDGIGYTPIWKLQFHFVDAESYRFIFSPSPTLDTSEVIIMKDQQYNFKYFDLDDGGSEIIHEPPRDQWDLLFTQYGSILYTDDGVPTPYYVRGVLLNHHAVMASVDSASEFGSIIFDSLSSYIFSSRQDFIGYEWKDVVVDVNSNSAVYQVKTHVNYIIKDTEGFYYKLRFVSFYDEAGKKGFPVFEYVKL